MRTPPGATSIIILLMSSHTAGRIRFCLATCRCRVYNRQFLSANIYFANSNCYIVYNDYNKNFTNNLRNPGDTVYAFANTNACYYKVDKKREVTKTYLFGEPARNEFKSSFIEGADFDELRGTYATLVQRKRGNNISLYMAWCRAIRN